MKLNATFSYIVVLRFICGGNLSTTYLSHVTG